MRWMRKQIRVSFRSNEYCPVNEVAAFFGGGGHPRAAGCTIEETIDQAEEMVLQKVKAHAMMHIAMHDALNAVLPLYRQFAYREFEFLAHPVVAAAQAARDVIVSQYAGQQAKADAESARVAGASSRRIDCGRAGSRSAGKARRRLWLPGRVMVGIFKGPTHSRRGPGRIRQHRHSTDSCCSPASAWRSPSVCDLRANSAPDLHRPSRAPSTQPRITK